jgi:hypothetical protein
VSRPVELRCPLSCLGLSQHAYQPLIRALSLGAEHTITVDDVLKLARREQLGEITGIGPTRITEIENALRATGFAIRHDHRQPGRQQPTP